MDNFLKFAAIVGGTYLLRRLFVRKSAAAVDVVDPKAARKFKFAWVLMSVSVITLTFIQARNVWAVDPGLSSPLAWSGLLLAFLGGVGCTWAIAILSLTLKGDQRKPTSRGPYNLARHPLYLSAALVTLGFTLIGLSHAPSQDLSPTRFLLTAAAGCLTAWLGAIFEDRYNIARFGDAYVSYMRTVPRLNVLRRLLDRMSTPSIS